MTTSNQARTKTPKERIRDFSRRILRHPRIDQLASEVFSWATTPTGTDILLVIGPTGVGKTTQQEQIQNRLLKEDAETIERESGIIPFLRIEAPAPESSVFSWKDFYIRILTKLEEPYPTAKQEPPKPQCDPLENASRNPNMTAATLRRALERAFHYRQTKILIIDEAQHLTKTGSSRRLQDHMDTLKSLANLSGVRLIMYGTYELLDLLQLNEQLARRCTPLHFRRYRWDCPEDRRSFLSAVRAFESRLLFEKRPNLLQEAGFLYERSAGCIGILKDWLVRALGAALDANGKITPVILKKTAPSHGMALTIAGGICNGEARYREIEEGYSQRSLGDLLSMNGPETPQAHRQNAKLKSRLRPGQRKPKRDPVGRPA